MENFEGWIEDLFADGALISLTLSDGRDAEGLRKVVGKRVVVRGERLWQLESHYERKAIHRNLPDGDAAREVARLMRETFRQGWFYAADADHHATVGEGGKTTLKSAPPSKAKAEEPAHNREKPRLIPESEPCDFLARLGVMTAEGKVIAARYDKFRQINRFLEMVDDVSARLPADRTIRILDFGCGKSYLTFAIHHYFTRIRGQEAEIVGADARRDVTESCERIARDLGCDGLSFQAVTIRDFEPDAPPDLVISLHACDTATDDALAKAVRWNATAILSVPCCQKEIFKRIRSEEMRGMLKHGIIKERLASLVTDSLRAAALELAGYRAQLLEFIDMEHTPKNVLIRAIKREESFEHERLLQEYRALRDAWGLKPYLEEAFSGLISF